MATPSSVSVGLDDPDQFVAAVPHETFTKLRAEAPVVWHEEAGGPGFWSVHGYDDVVAVNRDNITFSSARKGTLIWEQREEDLDQQRMMMLNMDPPLHTRYRRLVNKGFTPRMVSELEDNIRRTSRSLLAAAAEQGSCDFVTDVAAELPLQVIAELMGVPHEDRHLVFDWSNRMVGHDDPEYKAGPDDALHASLELYSYCNQLAAAKRADPGDDLVSVLAHAEVDGEQLSEVELDVFFLLLAVAGNETTRNLISHGMLTLLEHPDQYADLRNDHSLVATAADEMLRWATPVMHFRRTASCDTAIGGQGVAEGDKVVIWYISANRDESVFDDPFRFDIRRNPNPHVSFGGGGPHFCLGANLARMEARVLFEEMLTGYGEVTPAGPAERLRSNFINGIKHLPVAITPA